MVLNVKSVKFSSLYAMKIIKCLDETMFRSNLKKISSMHGVCWLLRQCGLIGLL